MTKQDASNGTKQRVESLFRFLAELHNVRRRPPMKVESHPWALALGDLPVHPAVSLRRVQDLEGEDDHSFHLEVRRATVQPCPKPPDEIEARLEQGWDDPLGKIAIKQLVHRPTEDDEDEEEAVEELPALSPVQQTLLRSWAGQRELWVQKNRDAARVNRIFQRLFGLWSILQREAESYELLLADGVLTALTDKGRQFRHPILLQGIELDFDSDGLRFSLEEGDAPPRLYTALLRQVEGVDGHDIKSCQTVLDLAAPRMAVRQDVEDVLRRLVQRLFPTSGVLFDGEPAGAKPPYVQACPYILLVKKEPGYAEAVERFLEGLPEMSDLPTGLGRVVDELVDQDDILLDGPGGVAHSAGGVGAFGDVDVLLTKPANEDQISVIQRLSRSGTVLVQGPPGTGKTHTIANLIGHLLAHGKSVLVTSHTTKALRVVRDHVEEEIRPLCVSVLESDREGRRQLEQAVNGIVYKLQRFNPHDLEREIRRTQKERDRLQTEIVRSDRELREACHVQVESLVVQGRSYSPAEAGRKLREDQGQHGWLPGPVQVDAPLPLSTKEIGVLYASNHSLPVETVRALQGWLPAPSGLLDPDRFDEYLREQSELSKTAVEKASGVWATKADDEAGLRAAIDALSAASAELCTYQRWQWDLVESTLKGAGFTAPVDELLRSVDHVVQMASEAAPLVVGREIGIREGADVAALASRCADIVAHLEGGGNLGWFSLVTRGTWKEFIASCALEGLPPTAVDDFKVLRAALDLATARAVLGAQWDRLIGRLGGPSSHQAGAEPERFFKAMERNIRQALGWRDGVWARAVHAMNAVGLLWEATLPAPQQQEQVPMEAGRIARGVGIWQRSLTEMLNLLGMARIQRAIQEAWKSARPPAGRTDHSGLSNRLTRALADASGSEYRGAFSDLVALHAQQQALHQRKDLLARLEAVAPTWAEQIRQRVPPHDAPTPPGDPQEAWLFRLMEQALTERLQLDPDQIQRRRATAQQRLQETNRRHIAARAWLSQQQRTNAEAMSALTAWTDTIRKIGKGTGKRAPRLKATAREQLDRCRDTVPVWIMPMSRVVETYDLSRTRFDVVIIDEASQLDVLGLLAFAFARQVVVVGDNEQVSPPAVGQSIDQVQALIDQYLPGIPNHQLYDGRTSIYDIARQRFGGRIRLREHFRCAREIIEFSNDLCYDGEITPLRDTSRSELEPHVVLHRVRGYRKGQVNPPEARETAALIVAATRLDAFEGKTMGVISMIGQEHAEAVDKLLEEHLDYSERTARRLISGTPAQFQGDERDIIFICMVDEPSSSGPLRLQDRQEYKQRLNVAASRARDQLWVITSLDAESHLKLRDLRRRFLQYAANPGAHITKRTKTLERTESPFEREVAARLMARGFRVHPQWDVGAFRLDMVIEGPDGQRVALECDGERFHGPEKVLEDIERQNVLERLGWRFVRVRGGAFYRDPDRAMSVVFDRLRELGVGPAGQEAGGEAGSPRSTVVEEVRQGAMTLLASWGEEAGWAEDDRDEEDEEETSSDVDIPAPNMAAIVAAAQQQLPLAAAPIDRADGQRRSGGPRSSVRPTTGRGGHQKKTTPSPFESMPVPAEPAGQPLGQGVIDLEQARAKRRLGAVMGSERALVLLQGFDSTWKGKQDILSDPRVQELRWGGNDWNLAVRALMDAGLIERRGKKRGTQYRLGGGGAGVAQGTPQRQRGAVKTPTPRAKAQRAASSANFSQRLNSTATFKLALANADQAYADPRCQKCGGSADVYVGRKGPYTKCKDKDCLDTESVPPEILQILLDQHASALRCKEEGCDGGLSSQKSWGTYVKCLACGQNESWKAYRERLWQISDVASGEDATTVGSAKEDGA